MSKLDRWFNIAIILMAFGVGLVAVGQVIRSCDKQESDSAVQEAYDRYPIRIYLQDEHPVKIYPADSFGVKEPDTLLIYQGEFTYRIPLPSEMMVEVLKPIKK